MLDKVKSFFGGKDAKEETKDDAKKNETSAEDTKNKTATTEEAKESISITKIPLVIEYTPTGIIPLSASEKAIAKKRIAELDLLDSKKKLREETRNALETFVYRVQDFLYNDVVEVVATEAEIEKFREMLSEVSDWIYDEGEHADTHVYTSKLKELQSIENPIQHRVKEYNARPENINLVSTTVKLARDFINGIRAKAEEARYHTEEELEALSGATEKVEKWMAEQVEAQKKLAETEDPVLVTSKVSEKVRAIEDHLMKLLSKKKPKKIQPKKEPEPEAKTEPEAEAEENKEETAKDETAQEVPPVKTEIPTPEEHQHDEL